MVFWDLMLKGGPVMFLIAICGIAALFIFVCKWLQFHREQINVHELIKGLTNVLKRDGFVEALTLCDNTPGPAARMLGAAILSYQREDEDLHQAIMDANLVEIPRLERYINVLGTIGYIAPLLGMLGTVLGMIDAFQTLSNTSSVNLSAAQLAPPIGMALITTAAGLCVAIPCYIAFNYLVARAKSMTLDMEKAASEIIYFFQHHHRLITATEEL